MNKIANFIFAFLVFFLAFHINQGFSAPILVKKEMAEEAVGKKEKKQYEKILKKQEKWEKRQQKMEKRLEKVKEKLGKGYTADEGYASDPRFKTGVVFFLGGLVAAVVFNGFLAWLGGLAIVAGVVLVLIAILDI